jgi:acetyl esterase/lipase
MRAALARSTLAARWLPRLLLAALLPAALVCSGLAPAHGSLGQRLARPSAGDLLFGGQDIAYGSDPRQRLSFWGAATQADRPAPLILFVHGGGWKRGDRATATGRAKRDHFRGRGYAFATMNYRLVPAATVEQQAADVASALAWLIRHAGRLGIDPGRIVLMGHSAGAHLVALVGTDPAYLRAVGLTQRAVAGVVPIDGAAYDVPAQMRMGAPLMHQTYAQAFGSDPGRQQALSPTWQAAAPNAPAFLLLHVQRPDGRAQARGLAMALRRAGTPVEIVATGGRGLEGHIAINRRLGQPGAPATQVVDAWLRSLFRR